MNVHIGPFDRAPTPVAVVGVFGLVTTIVVAKGARRLPQKAFAGLQIGLPIRWYMLSEERGIRFETVADAEVEWISARLTEFLTSLPRELVLLLVAAISVHYLWRATHPLMPEGDQA